MCAFSVTNKVPGVYIDEVLVPGVIAGVGTSTAAIVGPAEKGPIDKPTLVTNPTQFTDAFGNHLVSPRFYASYAVHAFFANGGTTAYFVRVGTAVRSSLPLLDTVGNATVLVTAKDEGSAGDSIQVTVQDANIASAQAARGSANLSGSGAQNNLATVDDSTPLRVGDVVLVDDSTNQERAEIDSIDSGTHTLTFTANLTHTYATGTVRVADLEPGQSTFRVNDSAGLEPGSYVEIAQNGTSEEGVVEAVASTSHFITLGQGLTNTYTMASGDPSVTVDSMEFNLLVSGPGHSDETFSELSVDPRHSRYFVSVLASEGSEFVDTAHPDPPNVTAPPANRPAALAATNLAGGQDDDRSSLNPGHYQTGIDSLEKIDDVNILCIPDRTDLAVQGAMIAHCQKMQDRFAILDPQRGVGPSNGIRAQRDSLTSDRGYGALYYPWIWISDPNPDVDQSLLVPPSGHIAGVFARTDEQKGVHKAPANEALTGVLDLERTLNDTEAGLLNENSINVLRRIPGRGFRIWGARTLATSTQWRYVNVRRLLLYIEESIQEGTRDAVFEPNNLALWQNVKRQVTDFLTRVWRDGALFGATPEEAFRVRVDEELNPPSEVALGKLTIEVMLRPTVPAEFIIFRIIQDPSRAIVEE